MTWYRFGREIGDDNDLANYMLDAVSGANDDPDGPMWARKFMEYINDRYTAYDILMYVSNLGVAAGYFEDWAVEQAKYDDGFGEHYGFEWRE